MQSMSNKFNMFMAKKVVHMVGNRKVGHIENKHKKCKNQISFLILEGKLDVVAVDVLLRIFSLASPFFEQEYLRMVGNCCLKCKQLEKYLD